MRIASLDSNLKVESTTQEDGAVWISCLDEPFEIRGLMNPKETGKYCRIAESLFPAMNHSLRTLSRCTAGGRIRFRTDSPYIIVKAELTDDAFLPHMPLTGSSGVDLYVGSGRNCLYRKSIMPPTPQVKGYEGIYRLPTSVGDLTDVTLNLPLYNGISQLYIGLKEGSAAEGPRPYAMDKTVLYYGSSITQGGCASRPGNAYPSLVSRWLDCDHINLGFSGNAKGESYMAEYIAGLGIDIFVMDYDHNAPDPDYLKATHGPFFRTIRSKHPRLPVIFMSKPDYREESPADRERRDIVEQTYRAAVAAGDANAYFVGGDTLFGERDRDACTVDGCHPNDLGFMRMAETLYPTVVKALSHPQL